MLKFPLEQFIDETLSEFAEIFVARMFDDVCDVFTRLDTVELRAIRLEDVKDVARTLVKTVFVDTNELVDKLVASRLLDVVLVKTVFVETNELVIDMEDVDMLFANMLPELRATLLQVLLTRRLPTEQFTTNTFPLDNEILFVVPDTVRLETVEFVTRILLLEIEDVVNEVVLKLVVEMLLEFIDDTVEFE